MTKKILFTSSIFFVFCFLLFILNAKILNFNYDVGNKTCKILKIKGQCVNKVGMTT